MGDPGDVERCAPRVVPTLREVKVVADAMKTGDDRADAPPGVQPTMSQGEFRRGQSHLKESEGGGHRRAPGRVSGRHGVRRVYRGDVR
jgi:hypothetical protein